MTDRPINTSHVYPPISYRTFDWCAWFDDVGEEASPRGWGATEQEAIDDLLEMEDDDEDLDPGSLDAALRGCICRAPIPETAKNAAERTGEMLEAMRDAAAALAAAKGDQ
jgi:hypothetical protein